MKKLSLVLGLVAVLLFGAAAVSADEETPDTPVPGYGACGQENFIDEDGDGVCDLLGSGMQQRGRYGVSATGQRAMMGNRFVNFVDEDGDGVCDNCGTGQKNGPRGFGMNGEPGRGLNGTPGANFVDEDGDGVCDNCGTGQMMGPQGRNMTGTPGANFVDEDGDGVCDNCGTGQMNGPRGRGNGQGFGRSGS